MSRFASDKLQTIDLGNDEWVKIPVAMAFREVMDYRKKYGNDMADHAAALGMVLMCLKEWNIKDEDGNVPEITEENILKLDIPTINLITTYTTPLFVDDTSTNKKKLPESKPQ